jgi:NAD(P)-dependent dehydrogenase (short-subunit alcohol dehydrogenase family)
VLIVKDQKASVVAFDLMEQLMETNFYGTMRITKACLPLLQKSQVLLFFFSSESRSFSRLDSNGDYGVYRYG